MDFLEQEYRDLVTLSLQYLNQEFLSQDSIPCDESSAIFFSQEFLKTQIKEKENKEQHLIQEIKLTPNNLPNFGKSQDKLSTSSQQSNTENSKASELIGVRQNKVQPHPVFPSPSNTVTTPTEEPLLSSFKLEVLSPCTVDSFNDIKAIVNQVYPNLTIQETIPSDALARQISSHWKYKAQIPDIVILSLNTEGPVHDFFNNLTQAINLYLAPAKTVHAMKWEKNNTWQQLFSAQQLRHVLIQQQLFDLLPNLKKSCHSNEHGDLFFKDKPLTFLPDFTLYFEEPSLKASLWDTLSNLISS
ncbi:MAG: hypothetical protein K0S74_1537 [Chlamydiales bacterium]|jgi:hypothetical protein|nr:hypothetical protein [Chlamydiales bacterium]